MNSTISVVTLAGALLLSACQTSPPSNAALEDARAVFGQANGSAYVKESATVELARARQSLDRAEAAWTKNRDEAEAQHLAYVARQDAVAALETGSRREAETKLQQSRVDRERIRADVRSREAQLAQSQAALAQAQANSAQAQAAAATAQANVAQQQAQSEGQRAALLQAALEQLSATQTSRGMVMTLQDVLFDVGQAQLRSGALHTLDQLAQVLKDYPEQRLLIEGYTDSAGSDAANLQLSRQRAEAVRLALVERGISGDRIETRANGENFPVATNQTPSGRQMNRRVEVLFSDEAGRFPGR